MSKRKTYPDRKEYSPKDRSLRRGDDDDNHEDVRSATPPLAFRPQSNVLTHDAFVKMWEDVKKNASLFPKCGVLYFNRIIPRNSLGIVDQQCLEFANIHPSARKIFVPRWAQVIKKFMGMNDDDNHKSNSENVVRVSIMLLERTKPFPFSGLGILLNHNYSEEECAHPTHMESADQLLWNTFVGGVDSKMMTVKCISVIVTFERLRNAKHDCAKINSVCATNPKQHTFSPDDAPLLCSGDVKQGEIIQFIDEKVDDTERIKIVTMQTMLIIIPKLESYEEEEEECPVYFETHPRSRRVVSH